MVQLDGSHHDWFEGRREPCVLMVMVDDATNRMRARFFEEETTRASYDVFEGWVHRHRLRVVCMWIGDSIYRCEGVGSIAEQLAGKPPQTQFWAGDGAIGGGTDPGQQPASQGACGTDERGAARPAGQGNASGWDQRSGQRQPIFGRGYLRAFHRQFGRVAASPVDVHRAVARPLNEVLSWEEERVVQGDWTVTCGGKRYQLDRQHEALSLVRRKVIVRTLRNGRVQLVYQGKQLKWRALPEGAMRQQAQAKRVKTPTAVKPPSANHLWRRFGMGVGRNYWRGVKASGQAERLGFAGLRSASATLRPPCVPQPQPGKEYNEQQPKKGTFSRKLSRGHF